LAVSLRASSWQIFLKLRFPNSLPYLFGGLKISITMSLVGAIVAEFVTSQRGLGYVVNFANTFMDTPLMFVGVVILSVMGGVLYLIIMLIEHMLMPWHVTEEEMTMTTG
jgi:NitT/TauT family transport system permease protein